MGSWRRYGPRRRGGHAPAPAYGGRPDSAVVPGVVSQYRGGRERGRVCGTPFGLRDGSATIMIEGSLNTTNVLLGIMAAVSLVQALVLIGVCVFAFRLYRRTLKTITDVQERQIAPIAATVAGLVGTVDGILADVKDVTARVARQTGRVDDAVQQTVHAAENTARRAFGSAAPQVFRVAKFAVGTACAVQGLLRRRRKRARSTK